MNLQDEASVVFICQMVEQVGSGNIAVKPIFLYYPANCLVKPGLILHLPINFGRVAWNDIKKYLVGKNMSVKNILLTKSIFSFEFSIQTLLVDWTTVFEYKTIRLGKLMDAGTNHFM